MTRASDRSPDLAGLTAFTGREDRQSALFFAGRAREIEAVERTCAAALDSVRAGAPFQGATRLFQGAPGAGKTALLTALQQRWGKPDAPADAPLPVVLEWGHLHSEAVVAGAILKAVDPAMEETYCRTGTVGLDAGLRIPGVSVGGRVSGSTAPPSLTFLELVRAVPPSAWTRPVCLMVDEIQMVNTPTMNVLNQLHSGSHGLPIVPLYAGLGSSLDVLATHGLSRLGVTAVHDIGALAPEEAQGAVRMMFERYRVDLEGVDHDWPSELASLSECWPQHLHNAMRALAEGLSADVWLLLIPRAFWTGIGTIAPSATAGAYRRPWTKRAVWSARSWRPCQRRACGPDRFWPRLRASRRRTWIPSGACRTA